VTPCSNALSNIRDWLSSDPGKSPVTANRLREGDTEMRQGIWRREANRGRELSGKTVGILGYGRMGSAFAQKLAGLGVRIVAHDKFKVGFAEGQVEEVDLDTLQREADVLSVHIDQRPGNDHFVDAAFLSCFAKPLTVINVLVTWARIAIITLGT